MDLTGQVVQAVLRRLGDGLGPPGAGGLVTGGGKGPGQRLEVRCRLLLGGRDLRLGHNASAWSRWVSIARSCEMIRSGSSVGSSAARAAATSVNPCWVRAAVSRSRVASAVRVVVTSVPRASPSRRRDPVAARWVRTATRCASTSAAASGAPALSGTSGGVRGAQPVRAAADAGAQGCVLAQPLREGHGGPGRLAARRLGPGEGVATAWRWESTCPARASRSARSCSPRSPSRAAQRGGLGVPQAHAGRDGSSSRREGWRPSSSAAARSAVPRRSPGSRPPGTPGRCGPTWRRSPRPRPPRCRRRSPRWCPARPGSGARRSHDGARVAVDEVAGQLCGHALQPGQPQRQGGPSASARPGC